MPQISLFELFCTFFYIGLFTIGGGLVAITLMQQTIVDRGLISPEQFYNMVAISESTPGPIGVNMATYLGYNFYGVPGAVVVSIGQTLPSLICIILIAKFLSKFAEKEGVKAAFMGIRPAATGLVFVAAVQVFLLALVNVPEKIQQLSSVSAWQELFKWPCLAFYFFLMFLRAKKQLHPIFMLLLGVAFGIVFL